MIGLNLKNKVLAGLLLVLSVMFLLMALPLAPVCAGDPVILSNGMPPSAVSVTGVTLDKTTLSLEVGESETLIATVTPDDADDPSVSWSSSDDTVATVDADGEVTAIAAGSATITVTTDDGGKTATCEVTVTESVTTYSVTVINGSGSGQYEEGATVSITANQPYEGQWFGGWYSEDEVVFVDDEAESTSFTMPAHDVTVWATLWGNIVPVVEMISVENVTADGATLTGQVVYDGGSNVAGRGFIIGTSPDLGEAEEEINCGSGVGIFTEIITELPTDTPFYVWAYAYNEIGYGYSGPLSFTTGDDQPGQEPTTYTVTFNANGGSGIMTPQTFKQGVSQALKANAFTLTGSIFIGWSTSGEGEAIYSDGESISITEDVTLYAVWEAEPYGISVTTGNVDSITSSSVRFKGRVATQGGAVIDERGFVYSASPSPEIGATGTTQVDVSGITPGDFTASVSGLEQGKTYYVRAYALAQDGELVVYGHDKTFTTRKPGGGSSGGNGDSLNVEIPPEKPETSPVEEEKPPSAGNIGYLDIPEGQVSLGSGNVILYTDPAGETDILGLGIVEGLKMKYVSRGDGKYEIIYNAKPFDDIAGHWAKDDIDFSSARLLFYGVTPNLFSPNTAMTRGMFVTVIGRMYGADPDKYTKIHFVDVPQERYYAPFIQWAAENGIVLGVSEDLFEPERPVSRQEMAVIMQKFMSFLGLDLESSPATFADDEQISAWAKNDVYVMLGTGILNGRLNNKFDPLASSTRAEVAVTFRRLIEHIVNGAL